MVDLMMNGYGRWIASTLSVLALVGLVQASDKLDKYRRETNETQYLVFQLTPDFFPGNRMEGNMDAAVKNLVDRIGTKGTGNRRYAFAFPIPTWKKVNQENYARLADEAFDAAISNDVAIYLYVESHEWNDWPELWNYNQPNEPGYDPDNKKNVEWSDWDGTPHPHRFRDWGTPEKMPPVMCYNAPEVLDAVQEIVRENVMPHLTRGLSALEKANKMDLFAGITVGAEPALPNYESIKRINPRMAEMMKDIGVPRKRLGYCALTNRGYSASNPPSDLASALADVNSEYTAYWAKQLVDGGISKEKLYTHVAAGAGVVGSPGLEFTNAPISIAFNEYSRPGWTTYPEGPLAEDFEILYEELAKHGNPHWAGTEANPAGLTNRKVAPEAYLSRHFDFGATVLVLNQLATSSGFSSRLEKGIWDTSAVAAYRSFLSGGKLNGKADTRVVATEERSGDPKQRIQEKLKKVREGIERGHRSGRDMKPVGRWVKEFESLLREGKLVEAEKVIDDTLEYLENK